MLNLGRMRNLPVSSEPAAGYSCFVHSNCWVVEVWRCGMLDARTLGASRCGVEGSHHAAEAAMLMELHVGRDGRLAGWPYDSAARALVGSVFVLPAVVCQCPHLRRRRHLLRLLLFERNPKDLCARAGQHTV